MSKQWQVGHTNAQAPQPTQRREIVSQTGELKLSLIHPAIPLTSKSTTGAGQAAPVLVDSDVLPSKSALPLSVKVLTSKEPSPKSKRSASDPDVLSGAPPTAEQKQCASDFVQAKVTTVDLARRC